MVDLTGKALRHMLRVSTDEWTRLMLTDEVYALQWITDVWEKFQADPSTTEEDWKAYVTIREWVVHCAICDIPKARGRLEAIRRHSEIGREKGVLRSDAYLK
jgi:hypothetical protein